MANPFGTADMAAGYATARPPVHRRIVERIGAGQVRRALDVGCGCGLSTAALAGMAGHRVGIEPAEEMLRWAGGVAPDADFVVGGAETLPFRDRSVDLITAAGSLNYADLDRFFPEAARVLSTDGVLAVYDFHPGRSFADNRRLDEWFAAFLDRYPPPPFEARALSPEILKQLDSGFRLDRSEEFEIPIKLTSEFYLDYMMTETNVAAAVRSGTPLDEVRGWCAETLGPVWGGQPHDVLFRGYLACLKPIRQ